MARFLMHPARCPLQAALVDIRAEHETALAALEEAQRKVEAYDADAAALVGALEDTGAATGTVSPGKGVQLTTPALAEVLERVQRVQRKAEKVLREREELRKSKVRKRTAWCSLPQWAATCCMLPR